TGRTGGGQTGVEDSKATGETPGSVRLARFYQQSARLQNIYRLVALGLMGETPATESGLRLAVRFAEPPDLAGFFTLEAELSRLLACPVDLLPVDLAPASPVGRPPTVTWVWQAKDFQG